MLQTDTDPKPRPIADINTTPLVDVMLVLLIIFLIAVPIAIQTIAKLEIPVFASTPSKEKVENLLLTVSTSDQAGRSAGDPGFAGAANGGECRIYINNVTPIDSSELRAFADERLKTAVRVASGIDAIRRNPDLIPQVHIRGDINAPWRCVAGAVASIQLSGYPAVGFISNPTGPTV